jgi:hypothetical protein
MDVTSTSFGLLIAYLLPGFSGFYALSLYSSAVRVLGYYTMNAWDVLNSKLVLLLLGFALTTILGGLLSTWLQGAAWKRQTRVDLFRKRYEEGIQLLDELSDRVGKRLFGLERFLWSLKDPGKEQRTDLQLEYFKIVADWNVSLRTNHNKIRLLIGEAQADLFLDYGDDDRPQAPKSLHYKFVKAHKAVIAAKENKISIPEAQGIVEVLNFACSAFLVRLTTDFLERATSLQLLEIPELRPPKSSRDSAGHT